MSHPFWYRWKRYTSLKQHLELYGSSSQYSEI